MTVEPWLVRAARARPQHEALRTPQGSLTYAELLEAARGAAGALGAARSVALALPPGRDFAVALHGCLLAGAEAVPVDPRLAAGEQAAVAAGCDLVVDAPLRGEPAEPRPHDLDRTAIVVHTSGTSGAPRRIGLTFGNWLWSALGAHTAMGLARDERWLCALPLSHVGGLSILVRSAIYATTAIVHERFEADRVLAEDHTVVSVVPTTLARLLDAGLGEGSALRCALVGGAPIPPPLLRAGREAGVAGGRDLRPDRGVLAGHHGRAPAVLHAGGARRRRRDPRQRAHGRARGRAAAAHRRPRPARRGRAPGRDRSQGRHDRHRRRERRARPRSRRRWPRIRRWPRPGSSAAPTPSGARPSPPASCCARA